jgi:hypothetical protein
MLDLTQKKLQEIVDGFVESIKVQLRAKPLGVEVSEAWILDLARNMASGLVGHEDDPAACGFCKTPYEMCCPNGCVGG